jgi:hypothetical protein
VIDSSNQFNNVRVTHLTDEQFTDLLLGSIPASVTAHLQACAECAEEAQRVSGAIGSFSQQSRLWAERRAAAGRTASMMPVHQPVLSWFSRPMAWSAAAAALAIATVVGVGVESGIDRKGHPIDGQQRAAQVQPARVVPAANPKADLNADNNLLATIDEELSAQSAPQAGLYGLKVGAHVPRSRSMKRMSN